MCYAHCVPRNLLAQKMVHLDNKADMKILVQWEGIVECGTTWEFLEDLRRKYPDFYLKEKVID